MIVHDCIQYSTKWIELRTGIPTASQFHRILTAGGKPSKSAEKYLYDLLAERCMGHPIEEYMSPWMRRGSEMERKAVLAYEIESGFETTPVGLMTTDDCKIGASPDRLVNEMGLLEVKCPKESIQMEYLLQIGSAYDEYKQQAQGQLWISGRQFVDLLAYHPDLPEATIRIERDETFIDLLSAAVTTFSLELDRLTLICAERGWLAHQRMKENSGVNKFAVHDVMRQTAKEILELARRGQTALSG